MKISDKTRKILRFRPEILAKVAEIQEKRFLDTETDAFVYCVLEIHSRDCAGYKAVLEKRAQKTKLTPEEKEAKRILAQGSAKDVKAMVMNQKARDICLALGGTEINNGNGTFGCDYKLYEKVGKDVLTGKRIVPYDLLTTEHVTMQYTGGTREEIDALLQTNE